MKKWGPLWLMIFMLACYWSGKGLVHEILGMGSILFLLIHLIQWGRWWSSLHKGIYNKRRILMVMTNMLFFIVLGVVIVTGIVGAKSLFQLGLIQGMTMRQWHHIHHLFGKIAIILMIVHVALRMGYFKQVIKEFRGQVYK